MGGECNIKCGIFKKGFESNDHGYKETGNRRNGYTHKTLKTTMGDVVMKALYLRITELYKKWTGRPVANWAMVRKQLSIDDKIQARILKLSISKRARHAASV